MSPADLIGGDLPPGACLNCDGCGTTPVYMRRGHRTGDLRWEDETKPDLIALWEAAETASPCTDGWHFVTCPCVTGTCTCGPCQEKTT